MKIKRQLLLLGAPLLLLAFFNNCAPGGGFKVELSDGSAVLSSVSGPTPVVSNPPILQNLSCTPGEDPAPTPLKRLSKLQHLNSVRSIFNINGGFEAFVGPAIYDEVKANYAMIPEDSKIVPGTGLATAMTGFDRTDSVVGQYHIDGYFFVAVTTANAFVSSDDRITTVLKAASSAECNNLPPSAACVKQFIEKIGLRAYRRPLKTDEVQSYKELYDATAVNGYKDGLASVVSRFLMSPQFLYHVELDGTPVNGREDLLRLTDYELAARLSYAYIDDIPTAKIFKQVEAGELQTDQAIQDAVTHLLTADDGSLNYQNHIRSSALGDGESRTAYSWNFKVGELTIDTFFSQWLKLYSIPAFDYASSNLQKLADMNGSTYLTSGPDLHHRHYADMLLEVENLYNHYTWNMKGSYRDLMTTDKLAYTSSDVQLVLHEPAWTGDGWKANNVPMPSYPAGSRDGILNRAAFFITGGEQTNPVKKGVFIQRQILCQQLPSPDPNALPDRSLELPDFHPDMTTRDRFADKTQYKSCQGCHSLINPTGFAFEGFDSVGRARKLETIFDSKGNIVGSPAVNTSAVVPLGSNVAVSVNGASALSHVIATSGVGDECFARQYFRYFYGRTESKGDGCAVKDLAETSMNSSMLDVFQRIPAQPSFKLHKVGPQ